MYFINVGYRKDEGIVDRRRDGRLMRPLALSNERLSSYIDLRRWMTPVEEQQDMNTCCANAFAGVCEYLILRYTGRHIDISRLFIYYNGQMIGQETLRVEDLGANQRDIALGLRKYGVCEEKTWPYEFHLLNKEPSAEAYLEASKYTVVILRVPFNVESIQTCLHNQIPVIVDIKLVDNVGRQIRENGGFLTIPDLENTFINRINPHSVLIVGYNEQTKHFIVRNSWGKDWGKEGYFHMPYDYIREARLIHSYDGLWTVKEIRKRGTRQPPTVRQFVLSTNQTLPSQPPPVRQSHHHRHHHHHHRHKFL